MSVRCEDVCRFLSRNSWIHDENEFGVGICDGNGESVSSSTWRLWNVADFETSEAIDNRPTSKSREASSS